MDNPSETPTEPLLTCCKCGGSMAQGFVVDATHGGSSNSHWAPGAPRTSFWTGVKVPDGALAIGAFRCSQCGYLEFYAAEVFERR
jgi:predicted nucleic-acid-binding Zn-ribbon protein